MPSIGSTMESGTLVEWRVKPGDHVRRGDIVAVVDTEKAALEVEIFDTGVIDQILIHEGETVPVGSVLATVRTEESGVAEPRRTDAEGAALSSEPTGPSSEPTGKAPVREPKTTLAPSPVEPRLDERVRISPAARKRATELSIDPGSIKGSGQGGAVTLRDVEAAALPEVPSDGRRIQVMRALGAAMERSKREIPHYYLASDLDVGRAQDWLEATNSGRPVRDRLLFAALLYKAVALSLKRVAVLNGYFKNGSFVPSNAVHLGIGVSLRHGGTVSPTIRNADELSLGDLMRALSELVRRTREGTLRASEMTEATATVTSLGDKGADRVFGVIHPPQVALVGFGSVRVRPWVVDGVVSARPLITASLSADHRANEGRQGARFLERLGDYLNQPEDL